MALSGQLRPLTPSQKQWALSNTISHYGFRLKSGMCTCMKCGHEWLEERNGTHLCPECGSIIEIKDTKERVIRDKSYFNVITTKGGYQVVRMFLMMVEMRKGMKTKPTFLEIGSYWIDDKGKATVVGIQRTLGHYIDSFAFGSPLEIRNDNDAFQRISDEWVYPHIKVTDTIKRNGFKSSCYNIHPVTLFQELLTNPKAETLMKGNDIELLRYLCLRPSYKAEIETYWNTIKVAKRNGYRVKDSQMWMDYIRMLERSGKDILSLKYICPSNLKEVHDKYVEKINRQRMKERMEADRKRAEADEAEFEELKGRYIGLAMTDGNIHDRLRHIKQWYHAQFIGFFTSLAYPHSAVGIRGNIRASKGLNINECKTGEAAEDKRIPHTLDTGKSLQVKSHHTFQFRLGKEGAFSLCAAKTLPGKRILRNPFVGYGILEDILQITEVAHGSIVRTVFTHTKEMLEILHKTAGYILYGNIILATVQRHEFLQIGYTALPAAECGIAHISSFIFFLALLICFTEYVT